MLRKLLPYMRGYRVKTALASLTVAFEVLLEVMIPFFMTELINTGVAGKDLSLVAHYGLMMTGMAVLSLCMGALSARFGVVASSGFALRLREGLFSRIQEFSFSNVDRFSTASLVTRLTNDVNNVQNTYMMLFRLAVRSPVMIVAATIMAARINTELSGVFFVAVPLLCVAIVINTRLAFPLFQDMLKKLDGMNASVQENLTAIRVIKAFVREKHEDMRFISSADLLRRAQVKAERLVSVMMPFAQFIFYGCMVAICWFGGRLIAFHKMQAGDLMGYIAYISQILNALLMLMMVYINVVITRASVQRINEVLSEKREISDEGASEALKVENGSVRFENVSFSYAKDEKNLTLKNVSFNILPGQTVGILGGTGSAKTTLVQLIPRLYEALSGSVLVGGHDVRAYTMENLREGVAMVLQNNVLFTGTLRDNLKWGNEDATDAQVEEACRIASAHDFITSFPNGYETMLGQGGVNLSGGQKQRVCIARALLKKPKIIILDDSTSAVDTATDSKIRRALREELKETTAIIIAQRVGSVMDADKIIVLDEGCVSAIGTHEELLQMSDIYREVFESQQKGVA